MNEIEYAITDFEEFLEADIGEGDLHMCSAETALAALREKQERDKGCEYCGNGRKQLISLMCHGARKPKYYNPMPRHSFCPMCGKRLEVEP